MSNLQIYTTGAYLTPQLIDGKYMWVVIGFEEPSYMDGIEVNTYEWADKECDLLNKEVKGDEL